MLRRSVPLRRGTLPSPALRRLATGAPAAHQARRRLAVPAVSWRVSTGCSCGWPRREPAAGGRHRPGTGILRSPRSCGRPFFGERVLADQRVREQRGLRPGPAAVQRRPQSEPLVRRHVRDKPAQPAAAAARWAREPALSAPTTAGTSITASSARNPNVPLFRTFTTCASPVARAARTTARPPPPSRTRRRAGQHRWLCVQRGIGVYAEQFALEPRLPPARVPDLLLGHHRVVRNSSTADDRRGTIFIHEQTGGARRARRSAPRGAASSSGSRSLPATSTARSQVRWFSPTWSRLTASGGTPRARRTGAGTRWPRCTARPRVPGVEQGAGDDAHRVGEVDDPGPRPARRRARSAIRSTRGTVRSALASPPAPVVSCPTQPNSSGQVSSRSRAACPPTRSWIRTAPRGRARRPGRSSS